jgi:hypothetical protein
MKRVRQSIQYYGAALLGLLLVMGMPEVIVANEVAPMELRGPSFGDQTKIERRTYVDGQTNEQRQRLDLLAYEIFDPSVPNLKYKYFRVESQELFKRFGIPKTTNATLYPHRDPGPGDPRDIEKLTWEFPGMVMEVISYPPSARQNPEKVMISRVEISSERYNLQNGLKVHQRASVFIARLGNPNHREEKRMKYVVEDRKELRPAVYGVSAYKIEMDLDENDVVRKIAWTWGFH